jgi:tetratricopeptide (TPR) repeat protein
MLFPSFVEARAKANELLIERCGLLCSVKNYRPVKAIAALIDSPVARLYEAVAGNDYNDPNRFFIKNLSDKHMGQAFLCVATSYRVRGDLLNAERCLTEACRIARKHNDAITFYQSQREMGVVSSMDGNHESALAIFESIFPLIRHLYIVRPSLYYEHFNCRAVELAELGRLKESESYCNLALASPYVFAYPEVFQTRLEIEEKAQCASHSVIALPKLILENNVVPLPVEYSVDRLAKVLGITNKKKDNLFHLKEWVRPYMKDKQTKKKPVEDKSTVAEERIRFFERLTDLGGEITAEQYRKMREVLNKETISDAENK